jgi:hypothetical protein
MRLSVQTIHQVGPTIVELIMSNNVRQELDGKTDPQTQSEFDQVRWEQLNPWLSEGQPDDRIPMNGAVKDTGGSPSARRAFNRRSHQAMFKKWSQERHD